MNRHWIKINDFLKGNITYILCILSFTVFSMSFIQYHYETPRKEAETIEKRLHARLGMLDGFASRALNTPDDQWVDIHNLPKDMVIYKYVSDTLQSWINLFPVHNDAIDRVPSHYSLHDLTNTNPFNMPLSFLGDEAQYANLGNSWYVVKKYYKENSKVIAGILINTEYLSENSILHNSANEYLNIDDQYSIVPVYIDDSNVVLSPKGNPLFSVVNNFEITYSSPYAMLRWVAIILAGLALFSYHLKRRSKKSLIITLLSLISLRGIAFFISKTTFHNIEFFSPSLYADGGLFDSLGMIILNHIFIFLDVLTIFMMRLSIIKNIRHSSLISRILKTAIVTVAPILIVLYIHYTLKSLILNSSIDLELYNIDGISIYSIVVFLSYALLFVALLLSLQLSSLTYNLKHQLNLLSNKGILIYLVIISLYTVVCIANYGFDSEFERNRAISNKLAIDRDLDLELHLRSIESFIQKDPLINFLVTLPNGGDLIRNRLEDLYFWGITNKYDIRITVCKPNDLLQIDNFSQPVDCYSFFRYDIIDKYGIKLAPLSNFFYLNNNNSFINYFGQFNYYRNRNVYNMYIEIDSKKVNESLGYPNVVLDSRVHNRKNLPNIYSYAKYYDNKLLAYDGRYNYPLVNEGEFDERYSFTRKNGYVHFVNKTSTDSYIIVSRKARSFLTYLVTFSYLFIFYSLILSVLFRFKRKSIRQFRQKHRNSFRNKITAIITTSMIVAIAFMGSGSILFIVRVFEENNRALMEDKLTSIHTSISELCKYVNGNTDIRTSDIINKINDIALNTQIDINIFNPKGKLLVTTKNEVFSQYLVSTRINPEAFKALVINNEKQVIEKEHIADLNYYSLYAPVFNINGKFIAILNIPYFMDISDVKEDATPIIATVINLFLILILAAILVSKFLSNSIAKPVVLISKKMQELDISQKGEHIDYSGDDELGALVNAYNNMVDDLEESTRRFAESEREQAWKEMARHIAHEIKNPLTPMQLSIQHLVRLKKQDVPNWDEKFYTTSASLLEQINILSQTASEFSSFAKFYNEDNRVFDLITLIRDQLLFFDNRDNITLELHSPLERADVMAKKDQITRVLINLISNAIQAIEYRDRGYIRVTVDQADKYYTVSVEDNGEGVKEENLYKLFKPNFTTKSSGTGLGLAICKSIIEQSNGEISYKRSDIGGANFSFKLPTYQQV